MPTDREPWLEEMVNEMRSVPPSEGAEDRAVAVLLHSRRRPRTSLRPFWPLAFASSVVCAALYLYMPRYWDRAEWEAAVEATKGSAARHERAFWEGPSGNRNVAFETWREGAKWAASVGQPPRAEERWNGQYRIVRRYDEDHAIGGSFIAEANVVSDVDFGLTLERLLADSTIRIKSTEKGVRTPEGVADAMVVQRFAKDRWEDIVCYLSPATRKIIGYALDAGSQGRRFAWVTYPSHIEPQTFSTLASNVPVFDLEKDRRRVVEMSRRIAADASDGSLRVTIHAVLRDLRGRVRLIYSRSDRPKSVETPLYSDGGRSVMDRLTFRITLSDLKPPKWFDFQGIPVTRVGSIEVADNL